MKNCVGYAGVATGTFHVAMTLYPEKVLFLKNVFDYTYFGTSRKIFSVNTNLNFNVEEINRWLTALKGK